MYVCSSGRSARTGLPEDRECCPCKDCDEDCGCRRRGQLCGSGCGSGMLRCANLMYHLRTPARLEVIGCRRKGNGVKAMDDIRKGAFVVEFVGTELKGESVKRLSRTSVDCEWIDYTAFVDNNIFIEMYRSGNISRFINHSCRPNTNPQVRFVSSSTLKSLQRQKCKLLFMFHWDHSLPCYIMIVYGLSWFVMINRGY